MSRNPVLNPVPSLGVLLFSLLALGISFIKSVGDTGTSFGQMIGLFLIIFAFYFAAKSSSRVKNKIVSSTLVIIFSFLTGVVLQDTISYILPDLAEEYYISIILVATVLLAVLLLQSRRTQKKDGISEDHRPPTIFTTESPRASMVKNVVLSWKTFAAFGIIVFALIILSVFAFTENQVNTGLTVAESDEYLEESLHGVILSTSNELNKSLPLKIDSETRLDTTFPYGSTMNYRLTLVNYTDDDFDFLFYRDEMKATIVSSYCRHDDMLILRENNIPVRTHYFDRDGIFLGVITTSNSDCEQ